MFSLCLCGFSAGSSADFFPCTPAADDQVEREAPTAPDPLGRHGLRGWWRNVAHRAVVPGPSQGRVVEGGGACRLQKPGGANEPAACTHPQPGQRYVVTQTVLQGAAFYLSRCIENACPFYAFDLNVLAPK